MIPFIAYIALFVLFALNGLASNWFVFGLWPHSWALYACFTILGVGLLALMEIVLKKSRS